MHPVVLSVFLQAVVSEVDVVVGGFWDVLRRRCAQVALCVVEKLVFARGDRPHADIEFSSLEQQWLFYVLLNDPQGVQRFGSDAFHDVLEFSAHFDALALV